MQLIIGHDFVCCSSGVWYCVACFVSSRSEHRMSCMRKASCRPTDSHIVQQLHHAVQHEHKMCRFDVADWQRPIYACCRCGSYSMEQLRGLKQPCAGVQGRMKNSWRIIFVNGRHPRLNLVLGQKQPLELPRVWDASRFQPPGLAAGPPKAAPNRRVASSALDDAEAAVISESDCSFLC